MTIILGYDLIESLSLITNIKKDIRNSFLTNKKNKYKGILMTFIKETIEQSNLLSKKS